MTNQQAANPVGLAFNIYFFNFTFKTPAMKKHLLLVALCAAPFFLIAQIQLEHTYQKGFLKRIRLDVSGEKYLLTPHSCDFHFFDKIHTPFYDIYIADVFFYCGETFLSEKILDDDDDIEVIYSWLDDGPGLASGTSVWDNGQDYQINASGANPIYSSGIGLVPKILIADDVYAVPGPVPEHSYGFQKRVSRALFPTDGERYIVYDYSLNDFDGFHFYDTAHNLVKSVNLPIPDFESLNSVTQQYFNDDAGLEFFGTRNPGSVDANGNDRLAEVVREDGAILLSEPCQYARLNAIPNLPDRLLIYAYSAPGMRQQKVFDAPTLSLLHTFPFYAERISPDGVMDYYLDFTHGKDTMFVYNSNFQLEKIIALSPTMQSNWNVFVTRNRFADNGKLEICYTTKNSAALQDSKVVCIDEDGTVLHVFPGATIAKLDQQAGMEDKLFVMYGPGDSTQVYDFTSQTISVSPSSPTAAPRVLPNPFAQFFEIQFPQIGDYSFHLTDAAGRMVATQNVQQQQQTVVQSGANWPAGVYFLFVKNEQRQWVFKLVKQD